MKRLALLLAAGLLLLPLALAGPAGAYKISGTRFTIGNPDYGAASTAVDRAEIAAYIAAARPLYAQLAACSSSCDRLDFPPHRCPACASATAGLTRIARQAAVVQAKLARLDVPAELVPAHSGLITAASTVRVSATYMADTVSTTPRKLLVATCASPTRGRGGVTIVWRASPTIVRDATSAARLAQLDRMGSASAQRAAFVRGRWAAIAVMQRSTPQGTPGQQAMAYLVLWRDGVRAQAQVAGVRLPAAL
jgi:hypothetical protein